LKARKFTR